jgi:hypothetical protein
MPVAAVGIAAVAIGAAVDLDTTLSIVAAVGATVWRGRVCHRQQAADDRGRRAT